jgi:hypothetical protein
MRFMQRSRLVAAPCGTGVRFRRRRTSAGADIALHHLHQLLGDVFDDTLDSSSSSSDSGVVATGGWRLRQYERQAKTAADDDVSCLEIRKLESEHEGNCPVCQSEWQLGDEVRVLPCGHQFHTHCIDHWLTKHQASCPLCKKDVREEWEDVEDEPEEQAASEMLGGYAFQDGEFAHDFSEKMREKQIQTRERYAGKKRTRSDYEQEE